MKEKNYIAACNLLSQPDRRCGIPSLKYGELSLVTSNPSNKMLRNSLHELRKTVTVRPVYTCNFCCDFLLLIDVSEWINNECAKCVLPHLNICDWFTRLHPSKGENRTRNRSESCKCNRACRLIKFVVTELNYWV